jgi:hypothetical protein
MKLNMAIKAVFFTLGIIGAFPANASITYTYTDSSDPRFGGGTAYSGYFSVDSALADGSYNLATTTAAQPAGFTENFFTASFVDGSGVTRTPNLSLFDITIKNGLVSVWDIRATTTFTSITYSGGKVFVPVYHANSVLIYHDTNVPYTPGLIYNPAIVSGDYQTYYTAGMVYQESLSGLNMGPGVWSIATTPAVSAVPLPPSIAMFIAGLLGFSALSRKNPTKQRALYS